MVGDEMGDAQTESNDQPNCCALCGCLATLRRSHIIPEFLHRAIYDADHSIQVIVHGATRTTTLRKGVRERLLCDMCEGRLKTFEDYFVEGWRDNPVLNAELPGDFTLTGVDYTKLKLFLLSIIWRASVSTLPDFAAIRLGPHEQRIKQMLLASDAGSPDDYRIFAGLIWDPTTKRRCDNILMLPLYVRVNGGSAYRMVLGGASWTVIVSKHTKLDFDPLWLTPDGRLNLTCCSWDRFTYLSGAVQAVAGLDAEGSPR